uniref:Uncharacterized protein n=1 Tax=Megaselia scalaris TaxID=36166 RepID=T1GVG9_MEGSC
MEANTAAKKYTPHSLNDKLFLNYIEEYTCIKTAALDPELQKKVLETIISTVCLKTHKVLYLLQQVVTSNFFIDQNVLTANC